MKSITRNYRFRDKDPVIDIVRTGFELTGMSIKEVSEKAFVSEQTINRWLNGETRRPQNITVDCVLFTLGITRSAVWTKNGELLKLPEKKSEKFRVISGAKS